MLSPVAALAAEAVENAFEKVAIPLSGIAMLIAVSGGLSDHFRMDRLFSFVKGGVEWMAGLLIAAFVAVLSVGGMLGSAQDSTAARAARSAVESVVPIIGGNISDVVGTIASGAVAVKNAVGVTGMLLVLQACAAPILQIAGAMLSIKLAAAVLEPVAEPGVVRIVSRVGHCVEMLLAVGIGSAALVILLIGSGMAYAGGTALLAEAS